MLDIHLSYRSGSIAAVRIDRAQPPVAALLVGGTPTAALEILERLYAVCGRAQRAAAELALAAAAGTPLATAQCVCRARAVALESIQEHLWRLLVDWPRQLGLEEDRAAFRRWYRAADPTRSDLPAADLKAALEQDWLGIPLDVLAAASLAATHAWATGSRVPLGRVFARLLAREPVVAMAAFSEAPREAGAIARLNDRPWIAALSASSPLAARVAARIVDLGARLDAVEDEDAVTEACGLAWSMPGPGRGCAEVDVARGRLRHSVELTGGLIRNYEILVPTETNFAAEGAYGWHLKRERPTDAAAALEVGELWALALDPCLPYRVSVADTTHA